MPAIPDTDTATPRVPGRHGVALAAWPFRRRVVVAVLAPLLFLLIAAVSGWWPVGTSRGWTAVVVLVAVACATTLATYVPPSGTGLRPDLGCTPCAAVAAVSVLAAIVMLGSAPHDLSTAFWALGISVFGLAQRLNNPSTCPA